MLVGSGFEGPQCTNNKYVTDSYFVYLLKMEYASKINIFDLKMMMKSEKSNCTLKGTDKPLFTVLMPYAQGCHKG